MSRKLLLLWMQQELLYNCLCKRLASLVKNTAPQAAGHVLVFPTPLSH